MTPHSTQTVQEARRLHVDEGYGYHKIAKMLGVSRHTVRGWVRRPARGYTPPVRPSGRPVGCTNLAPGARRVARQEAKT